MENGVQSDSDSAGTNKNWFVYLRYELTVYIIFSQWMVLYVSRFINHIFYQHDYTHTHSYTHYYIILYIYFTNNFDLLRFIRHIYFEKPRCTSCCICTDQQVPQLSGARCDGSCYFPNLRKFWLSLHPTPPDVFHKFEIYVIGNTWYLVHTFSCIMSMRQTLPLS